MHSQQGTWPGASEIGTGLCPSKRPRELTDTQRMWRPHSQGVEQLGSLRRLLGSGGNPEKGTTLHNDLIGQRWTFDVGVAKAIACRVLDECLVFYLVEGHCEQFLLLTLMKETIHSFVPHSQLGGDWTNEP